MCSVLLGWELGAAPGTCRRAAKGFESMRRVAILGAGGMGTAIALLLSKAVDDVRLWSRDPDHGAQFARTRINERHLPGIKVPEALTITAAAARAVADAELIVAAVPTSYLRATLAGLAHEIPANVPFLSVVKGIEYGSFATAQPDHPGGSRVTPRGGPQWAEPCRGVGAADCPRPWSCQAWMSCSST